jgi:hypothetical protein
MVRAMSLMMETAGTSETLVNFYHSTRCCNLEDSHLHMTCRQNLKSYSLHKNGGRETSSEKPSLFQCISVIVAYNEWGVLNCRKGFELYRCELILFVTAAAADTVSSS